MTDIAPHPLSPEREEFCRSLLANTEQQSHVDLGQLIEGFRVELARSAPCASAEATEALVHYGSELLRRVLQEDNIQPPVSRVDCAHLVYELFDVGNGVTGGDHPFFQRELRKAARFIAKTEDPNFV